MNKYMGNSKNKSFIDGIYSFDDGQKSKLIDEFVKFLKEYVEPSFGSMSKRDIDIKIFNMMRSIGIIKENPEQWDIIRELKLSSTRARNLIYNANMLREGEFDKLDDLQKTVLISAPYLRDGNYISVQIDNPLLVDHIKSELKSKGYLQDGSFSPDIIRMKPEAFMYLYVKSLDEKRKEKLRNKLAIEESEDTVKQIARGLLKFIGGIKGSIIDTIVSLSETMHDMLSDEKDNSVDTFFKCIEDMKQEEEQKEKSKDSQES